MVFTLTAASRILNLNPSSIGWVRTFFNWATHKFSTVVLVWLKGKRPRFISRKAFYDYFVSSRKERATSVMISPTGTPGTWNALSSGSQDWHAVSVEADHLRCTCHDYQKQTEAFPSKLGAVACKHVFATLNTLGYVSLSTYVAAQQA